MARHPDLGFQVLDDAWFADALEADLPLFDDWAARLVMGEDPLPPGVLDAHGQLLGKHFESLIAAWLDASPHFRLRAHGVQLQQDKQTVGELDFLVDDLRRGRTLHIEVASKFYLAAEDGSAWENGLAPPAATTRCAPRWTSWSTSWPPAGSPQPATSWPNTASRRPNRCC